MGNLFSAQVNQNTQKSMNEVYQSSSQSCTASCSDIQSGNVIFLDGTTSGDISFTQNCTANANCMMDQALQSLTDQLLTLKQGNQTEANLFGGGINFGSVNLNLSDQEIKNQVTQIMSSLCTADVNNVQNGNIVYARNSKTGKISFTQSGNANADCVMQNAATAKANLSASATQSNAVVAGGIGGIIGLVIFIIILAIILGIVSRSVNKMGQNQNQNQSKQGGDPFAQLSSMYGKGGARAATKA